MSTCECGCGQPAPPPSKGIVRRFVRGHNTRGRATWIVEDRGYDTPCHVYLRRGEPTDRGPQRRAYRDHYGEIPEGHDVHHRCEHPPCINPEHLQAVTPAEHGLLHRKTHCKRDHEFTPENTLDNGQGRRKCRACHYEIVKRYHERIGRTCHSRKKAAA